MHIYIFDSSLTSKISLSCVPARIRSARQQTLRIDNARRGRENRERIHSAVKKLSEYLEKQLCFVLSVETDVEEVIEVKKKRTGWKCEATVFLSCLENIKSS